jgi:hypothetical protein
MDFMKAIAIVITSIFTCRMVDRLVAVAPGFQASVNIVFVGENQTAYLNDLFQDRLDRFLLHIRQHADDHLTITLDYAQDRRFFTGQGPAPTLAF